MGVATEIETSSQSEPRVELHAMLDKYFGHLEIRAIPSAASAVLSTIRSDHEALVKTRNELRSSLVHHAAQGLADVGAQELHEDIPHNSDVASLALELRALHSAWEQLQVRAEHEALVTEAERACKEAASPLATSVPRVAAALNALSRCKTSKATASARAFPNRLTAVSVSRESTVLSSLMSVATDQLRTALEKAQWPGSLSACVGEGGPWSPECSEEDTVILQQTITSMCMIQAIMETPDAVQGEASRSAMRPVWAAGEVAAPLVARIHAQFASGGSVSSPERPEWLFALLRRTVTRVSGDAPMARMLAQGCAAAKLGGQAPMVEAIATSAAPRLLSERFLPAMMRMPAALWVHAADEATAFDRYAHDVALPPGGKDEAWVAGVGATTRCLDTFASKEEWTQTWHTAELQEQLRRLDKVVDAASAWERLDDSAWLGELDGEFNPPNCAVGLVSILRASMRRCEGLADPGHRRAFVKAVMCPVIKNYLDRLERRVEPVRPYKELVSVHGIQRIGQCVCAAHYLEHMLCEIQDESVFLYLDQDEAIFHAEVASLHTFSSDSVKRLSQALGQKLTEESASYRANTSNFAASGTPAPSSSTDISLSLFKPLDRYCTMLQALKSSLDRAHFVKAWRNITAMLNKLLFTEVAMEAQFTRAGAMQFKTDCEALCSVLRPYTPRPENMFKDVLEACVLLTLDQKTADSLAIMLDNSTDNANISEEHHRKSVEIALVFQKFGVLRVSHEHAARILGQRR